MQKIPKLVLYGVLSWLLPFVIAIPFYSPSGEPLMNVPLFKSLMVVAGSATGAVLLVLYFRGITRDFLREGALAGFSWLLVNWILDILVLLPLSHQSIPAYAGDIGLRYLVIPVMALMLGYGIGGAVERQGAQ